MLHKEYIEKILALNGVSLDSPDEEIKSVLLSARWHEDDIDTAVLVLRENKTTHETHVDSVHKVFRTDERLRPETVSALLGVKMDISGETLSVKKTRYRHGLSTGQMMKISIIALMLSMIFVFAAMWYLQMGLFHQSYLH